MEQAVSPVSREGFDEAIPDTYSNIIDPAGIGMRQNAGSDKRYPGSQAGSHVLY